MLSTFLIQDWLTAPETRVLLGLFISQAKGQPARLVIECIADDTMVVGHQACDKGVMVRERERRKGWLLRAIGASAMYGYQFHNMQICAEKNGFTPFSTMQNHYNLLYREDERELIPVCNQYGVSRIPYSPLAGGHLSHTGWTSSSKRSETDKSIRMKYDANKQNDLEIIARVEELAKQKGVSMTVISLAWQYAKGVAAPIVGATNPEHFTDATKAVDLVLSDEDVAFLEEPYRAHEVVGALAKSQSLKDVMPKK